MADQNTIPPLPLLERLIGRKVRSFLVVHFAAVMILALFLLSSPAHADQVADEGHSPEYPDILHTQTEPEGALTLEMFRSAAERGNSYAQYLLGLSYRNGGNGLEKDDKTAADWLRKSAEQGYPDSQYELGIFYHKGFGSGRKDDKESIKWIRKAADQNFCDAQIAVGIAYYNGWGVEKDLKEAGNLWRNAANEGNIGARNLLDRYFISETSNMRAENKSPCIYSGNMTDMALDMDRKSAEQGNAVAQFYLGSAYDYGEGVERDHEEALKWWRKAAAQGETDARQKVSKIDGDEQSEKRQRALVKAIIP